ncbi:MAG: hypothetical protein A4E20_14030 [Nitrospira sp. SG-bin2]|uniref:hypothetical protein n=1 Tax=Nitrospira cf. moscoviensis SBR1015 TaxID=96242 RepID=UPI000A0A0CBF|nr:hypothetical protein [Nitrospira cf. moscoviensis SBR1015]OQW32374.1 MAG: hypothetical protein A4E20_14030 [Nitrospira sp. SG-bin2]
MYDEDHHKTIAQLISRIGSQEECLRLGFLSKDDNATLRLSPAGMGYLIDVVASDVSALPDAYAAGYTQGHTQAEEGL